MIGYQYIIINAKMAYVTFLLIRIYFTIKLAEEY